MNPLREDFKITDEDGEEFHMIQDFKSIDDGSEEFPSNKDGNEYFPSNDGDEFPNYAHNDYSEDNIPPNDDENASIEDNEMKTLQENIVFRSRSRTFHIIPKYSSYARFRTKYLTQRSSIGDLILGECCRKYFLKHIDFKFSLEKRKRYLSMNKSMQDSYLVGYMQSTLAGYDYHIGNVFLYRNDFKMLHSIGNFVLSRIQEILEKDPTFYLEICYRREVGPLENT